MNITEQTKTLSELKEQFHKPTPWYKEIWYFLSRYSWSDIPYWIRHFKWWYQRLHYGVSDRDCWSLDCHLARVIIKGCDTLINRGIGHPTSCKDFDEWVSILTRIRNSYQFYIDVHDGDLCVTSSSDYAKGTKDMKLLQKYFGNLWD